MDPRVSFLVLMAGPGVRGDRLVEQQIFYSLLAAGAPTEQAETGRAVQRRVLEIVESTTDQAEQAAKVDDLMSDDKTTADVIKSGLPLLNTAWYRFFIQYDPAPALERLKIPVLALDGGKDTQVDPAQNMPAIQAALDRGKNADATVRLVPGVNHFFQTCTNGYQAEYSTIQETISPAVLELVGDWIIQHVK
jgi:fermentation-respiration switch protein FrsA (DUF1100 family)